MRRVHAAATCFWYNTWHLTRRTTPPTIKTFFTSEAVAMARTEVTLEQHRLQGFQIIIDGRLCSSGAVTWKLVSAETVAGEDGPSKKKA